MRNHTLIFSLLLSFTYAGAQSAPNVTPVDTLIRPLDSIPATYNWSIRAPLSTEEQQKREDDRARVEEMKKRFRDFHQTEKTEERVIETMAEEQDYLWSEAEQGGEGIPPKIEPTNLPSQQNEEELRMEIGRNLQVGKKPSAAQERPFLPPSSSSDQTKPPSVEAEINAAFQRKSVEADSWERQLDSKSPLSIESLSAGQIILLPELRFTPKASDFVPSTTLNLAKWGTLLQQQPGLKIEVRAHASDNLSSLEAIELSAQRAKSVVDYWLAQGASIEQLSYRGYGLLSPLVPTDSPMAQQKNERIELIILELPQR